MKATSNHIEDFLIDIQSKSRFALTWDELQDKFESSDKALKQNLYRLKNKNRLAQVRREFYVIIPPQYSKRGMVPPTLFINDMMLYLDREYYIGLFSAAALHGAGHQQSMQFQVMIKKPALRPITNKKLDIHFFVKSSWDNSCINEVKTDSGYIKVSSPALTAFDLVKYNKQIGGLNRVIPILEDLLENIKPSDLKRTAAGENVPNIQRTGYLFEHLGQDKLAKVLFDSIENKDERDIPLSIAHNNKSGVLNERWKVIQNVELDI